LQPGTRLALWPGTQERMRADRANTADFPDAGYELVTSVVKDRTMRRLITPNDLLFNQSTGLPVDILCDARAVQFLQLRYLLAPHDAACPRAESGDEPWRPLTGVLVDRWLEVREAASRDNEARAVSVADLTDSFSRAPALSVGSSLLGALAPVPGTSVRIGPRGVVVEQDSAARLKDRAIVLPVAYDSAWTTSSGQVRNVGGLLALLNVDQPRATLTFVPDAAAILLALGMTVAQLLSVAGLAGLASVRSVQLSDDALSAHERRVGDLIEDWRRRTVVIVVPAARRAIAVAGPVLRDPQSLLCLLFSAAIIAMPQRENAADLLTALLLPITTIATGRVSRWPTVRNAIAVVVLAAALVLVAIAGSRAAEALHDPLFWGIVSAILAVVALATARWRPVAVASSTLAGGVAAYAILLPNLPNFDVAFPTIDLSLIGRSLTLLADQWGVAATAFLLALWVHAIAFTWRGDRMGRVEACARGALIAFVLCLAGAMTPPFFEPASMATLGLLLGATDARK
ncbi:MAG TPA: hypothetical protein VH436_12960, partial [Vicinamibacterales bacterium]